MATGGTCPSEGPASSLLLPLLVHSGPGANAAIALTFHSFLHFFLPPSLPPSFPPSVPSFLLFLLYFFPPFFFPPVRATDFQLKKRQTLRGVSTGFVGLSFGTEHPERPVDVSVGSWMRERGKPWQKKVANLKRRILPPFCSLSLQCSLNMICQIPFPHVGMVGSESQEKRNSLIWAFSIIPQFYSHFAYKFRVKQNSIWCSIWSGLHLRHSQHLKLAKDLSQGLGIQGKVGAGPCSQGYPSHTGQEVWGCHQTETFPKASVFRTEKLQLFMPYFYKHFFNCSSELLVPK